MFPVQIYLCILSFNDDCLSQKKDTPQLHVHAFNYHVLTRKQILLIIEHMLQRVYLTILLVVFLLCFIMQLIAYSVIAAHSWCWCYICNGVYNL